jgi:release factor glutamine methyltransferase
MTILELLHIAKEKLVSEGISNPKTSSEILLSAVLNAQRLHLYINYNQPVTSENEKQFWEFVARRANHEPLQYILGETEFMSLPFSVNPSVLIPRPETELLVETVMEYCKIHSHKKLFRIADIGTGSGNIAVSIAYHIPNTTVIGIDSSEKALRIAQMNAQRNKVQHKVSFLLMDVLYMNRYQSTVILADIPFDVVVSNPPYILPAEYETLPREVQEYEPSESLKARGEDGLEFYSTINKLAYMWLKRDGVIALEVSPTVSNQVMNILQKADFHTIHCKQDYSHQDRIVSGIR